MVDKDIEILSEIVLRKGKINNAAFLYNNSTRNDFLNKYGLIQLNEEIEKLEKSIMISDDPIFYNKEEEKKKDVEKAIADKCRKALLNKGLDLSKIEKATFISNDDKKNAVINELKNLNLSSNIIEAIKSKDCDLSENDSEYIVSMPASSIIKEELDKEHIEFSEENGNIKFNIKTTVKEGISFNATPEAKKFLNDNDIQYIEMAQNRTGEKGLKKYFVPLFWSNSGMNIFNSQITKNILAIAALALLSPILSLAGSILVLITLRKTGLLNAMTQKKYNLSHLQTRALQKGLSVYSEENIKGKHIAKYYYMENGNLCSINARDVKIPNRLYNTPLSPAQMQKLKNGELVSIVDKRGIERMVRIDVMQNNLIREFYKNNLNNNIWKEKPNRLSDDKTKLEWINQKGFDGIKDLYSEKRINLERDTFLEKYGIRTAYNNYLSLQDKNYKTDNKLISIASEELKDITNKALHNIGNNKERRI